MLKRKCYRSGPMNKSLPWHICDHAFLVCIASIMLSTAVVSGCSQAGGRLDSHRRNNHIVPFCLLSPEGGLTLGEESPLAEQGVGEGGPHGALPVPVPGPVPGPVPVLGPEPGQTAGPVQAVLHGDAEALLPTCLPASCPCYLAPAGHVHPNVTQV